MPEKDVVWTFPTHTPKTNQEVAEIILDEINKISSGRVTARIPVGWGWKSSDSFDVLVKVYSRRSFKNIKMTNGKNFIRFEFTF